MHIYTVSCKDVAYGRSVASSDKSYADIRRGSLVMWHYRECGRRKCEFSIAISISYL